MELLEGKQKKKEGQGKKIIGISIAVLVIILAILIAVIFAMRQSINKQIKLSVDGKKYKMPEGLMITQDETTYISISYLASYVGYEFYNGEYKEYTEDRTKGYVECENEIAGFSAESKVMYKNNAKDKLNFDLYELELPVIAYNNLLYASIQDIGKIYNSQIFFKQSNNTLIVQTMPYLITYYTKQVANYGYDGVSEDFITQKAVAYNMLVVKKDGNYGVVSTEDFSRIIGTRYEKMVFLESTQEFVVTSGGKTGLISANGDTQIALRYDDIGLIDTKNRLYYAKNDDLFGVLNENGKVLVYLEYNSLGVDREDFSYDSIKNNMFLYENCIPIMKYEIRTGVDKDGKPIEIKIEKWGLADKLGNILLNTVYDSFGYVEENTSDRSINNVAIIPKIKGIVMGKDGKYGVVNSIGKMIIPYEFDKIYSITNEGKDEFYLEQDGKTIKLDKYITDNKIEVQEEETPSGASSSGGSTVNNTTTNNTTTNSTTNNTNNTTTQNQTIIEQNGTTTVIVM